MENVTALFGSRPTSLFDKGYDGADFDVATVPLIALIDTGLIPDIDPVFCWKVIIGAKSAFSKFTPKLVSKYNSFDNMLAL